MSAFTRRSLSLAALAFAAVCLSPVPASAQRRGKVIITLGRGSVYFLDGKQVTRDQIEPLLAARVRKDPSVVAVIRADRHQTFGQVSQLMSLVQRSGIQSVMIAAPFSASAPHHTHSVP